MKGNLKSSLAQPSRNHKSPDERKRNKKDYSQDEFDEFIAAKNAQKLKSPCRSYTEPIALNLLEKGRDEIATVEAVSLTK